MTISTSSNALNFVSLKKNFINFVNLAQEKSIDEQVRIWVNEVESYEPEIFYKIYGISPGAIDLDRKRRERALKHFPKLFELKTEIITEFNNFEQNILPVLEKLEQDNPDADFSNVVVFAIPSLMRFNGQVGPIIRNGKTITAVKFGLDMISFINQSPGELVPGLSLVNDLPVLVTHEFTHALHSLISDFGVLKEEDFNTLAYPLWMEGIAQLNSQVLVPGTSYENMLMEKKLSLNCTSTNVKKWASEYLNDLKITDSRKLDNSYSKWFNLSPKLKVSRAGYCLGYHVALMSSRDYSIYDLLRLSPRKVKEIVESILTEISSN